MLKCPICNFVGGDMRRCKKCGQIYHLSCSTTGKITGKPVPVNKCPYCGAYNQSEKAR